MCSCFPRPPGRPFIGAWHGLNDSSRRRSFELNDVAFRVRDIDGRTLSLSAVTRLGRARRDAMRFKQTANAGFVERLEPKAQVIQVSPFRTRRCPACTAQFAVNRHQIDHGPAGPQLYEAY